MITFIKNIRDRLYTWYGKMYVRGAILVLFVLFISGVFIHANGTQNTDDTSEEVPSVTRSSVSELMSSGSLELLGTVEAVDEVRLESEAAGRVTQVPVALGDTVRAGTVIARIENADERARLLQAEGAYESAVAAAASSNIGLKEAQNNAVSTYRDAYTTVHDIVINTIDTFFTDPKRSVPGLRIEGFGNTTFLNNERSAYNALLSEWQQRASALSVNDDLNRALEEARARTVRTKEIVQTFLRILPRQDERRYSNAELDAFQNEFVNAERSLNTTLNALDAARESLTRAEISGTGGAVSSANAQVKQALGSLRAAQANFEKTIIRTPINGTVNTLSIKSGEYVSVRTPVGVIANNDSLLITTYVSSVHRNRIAVGDTVDIEGGETGLITNIAPVIDPATKKIEVKIETGKTDSLNNGDTVRVFVRSSDTVEEDETVSIPIKSLKVGTERTVVFTVSEENTLEAHEVEVGPLMGNQIIIRSGITPDMMIVEDARGLSAGDRVLIQEQ